jgi:hypothetical protein
MNAARVEKSDRLSRVLGLLRRRGEHGATSMEIVQLARTVAVSACVAELRANGYRIHCERKGRVWTYRLH